jgi:hypothetical protein
MSTGPNSPVVNVHGSQNSSPLLGELPPPQSSSEHGGGGGGGFSIEHAPAHSRPLERNHVPPNSGLPPVQEQYRPYRPANIVP